MKTIVLRLAVIAVLLCSTITSRCQNFGSLEWAMGMMQNMAQNAFQIYHYVSDDGSGIIIDPVSKLITYCEYDKRSSLPFYETTINGNKAYVSPYRNITAYPVTQNGKDCLLVTYDSRSDFMTYYYVGRDGKVDSYLRTPNTPLKNIFATCATQHWNAQAQAQGSPSSSYGSPSSGTGYGNQSSKQSSSATITNREGYQRAYDGYADMLRAMKYGNYPYQSGFNIRDMQDIQSKMRALRNEWNSAHPDLPITSSPMESWNGSRY